MELILTALSKTQHAIDSGVGSAEGQDSIADKVISAAQPVLKREWVRVKKGK